MLNSAGPSDSETLRRHKWGHSDSLIIHRANTLSQRDLSVNIQCEYTEAGESATSGENCITSSKMVQQTVSRVSVFIPWRVWMAGLDASKLWKISTVFSQPECLSPAGHGAKQSIVIIVRIWQSVWECLPIEAWVGRETWRWEFALTESETEE